MAKVAITEQYLTDIADAIRTKTGLSTTMYYPSEMAAAILTISGSGGITPSGTIQITSNGTYNVTQYASANVNVPTGSTINNQDKSVSSSETTQIVTFDDGYTGLGEVTITGLGTTYVGSGITRRTSSSLTASGATVTVPAGYYSSQVTKTISSGSVGTPTASKGTVNNYSVSVTPSVSYTAGYISGGSSSGTAVTISASELVSGNKVISSNGTNIDVTNYATVSVNVPTGSTISNQNKTVNPTESEQEITFDSGYTGLGIVTIGAISSTYVGSGISRRTSSNLTVNGATVTAPSGYYSSNASASVASGTAGTPTATKGTVSNHSVSVTPSVTNTTGYITGSTKTGTAVTVSASELVSGSQTVTENGTVDVTNLAEVVINVSGGGGGEVSNINVGTATQTLSTASNSIQFTNLSGNPTSFVVISLASITTNTNGVTQVVFDGTDFHGQILTTQATADTGFTKSYSGSTLTITATTGSFRANEYKLVYTYGGSTSDIKTADVQVGSGATSVTFPISGNPTYWSCIFKSDFSTSSGYQRVIGVANDGISTYGLALDSSANALTSWTANYSGGNFTITSQGTNNGGYFHQPGYYQLTYVTDSGSGGGGNYQTKTITPTSSQQIVTPDSGYDALSQVTVNAIPNTYVQPTATKGATTYIPTTTSQTIASGTYLTGIQTISGDSNLIAGNIKSGVSIFGVIGSYEGSGGGGGDSSGAQIDSFETVATSTSSISFTGLKGEPTSFSFMYDEAVNTGTPAKIIAVVFDGTNLHAQTITNTSNAQVTYDDTSLSKTYSNGTLTITSNGPQFVVGAEYYGTYIYDGIVNTKDVQVGSGATSITFTGLNDEPVYWSCIFKSNFGTSSGYQRTIYVSKSNSSVSGFEMDSSAKNATHWTSSYSNGNFTITSQGTNQGGYFHQPGYYQLTYATASSGGGGGGGSVNYQTKIVTPTTLQQIITPDEGYDALSEVTVGAIPNTYVQPTSTVGATTYRASTSNQTIQAGTYHSGAGTIAAVTQTNLTAANIKEGTTITISNGQSNLWSVTGTYAGESGKNVQAYRGYATVTATSYTATAVSVTVAKTGTYNVSWMGYRNTNSGTSGSQLYKNGTAVGSANTTFVNTYGQSVSLTNQSFNEGDVLVVRARARSTSYVMGVGNLIIEEV